MNNTFSKAAIWVVVGLLLFMVFKHFDRGLTSNVTSLPYSEFLDEVRAKHIKDATIDEIGRSIVATTTDGKKVRSQITVLDTG
ncbi:MAG: ATP-dependent metallopeptidase FtsH/Yme1/Tma family protein, partial [Burkholderiaceae bacterium]|nr:ATP-dependent metallopeptidase FtsH/Yme1/Tma family protein [Burkholderiaceae bacterium]